MIDWRDRLLLAVQRSHRKHSAIARDAGIAPETLSRILHARHAHPQFETVVRIAQAVNVRVGWLMGEPGYQPMTAEEAEALRQAIRVLEQAATRK